MKRISLVLPVIGLVFACAARQQAVTKEPASTTAGSNPIAVGDHPKNESAEEPGEWGIMSPGNAAEYARVVDKVSNMTNDGDLQARVARRKLSLVNVMWEDTGRSEGSALGPNISDLTLQVRRKDANGQFQTSLMPVIRPPNFVDRTGDVPADRFFIRVGNERDGALKTVPLTDVLRNLKSFASHPESILGDGNLLAPRDSHFLVSAQAVFLPIPKSGKAEFNPVLFNYQSAPGSPAVLTILVTRQGSSMQVIENKGDDTTAFGSGQQLYFNDKGNRSAFTAERKTDVEQRIAAQGGPKTEDDKTALQKGADVLFLVQIPLKHHNLGRLGGPVPAPMAAGGAGGAGGGG